MQVNKCERGGSVHLICMLEVDYLYDSSILFDIPQQIDLGKARTFEIIHERQIVSKYILQAKMGKSNNCPWGPNWWTININFKNLPNVHFSKTKFRNPSLFKLNCPQRLSHQGMCISPPDRLKKIIPVKNANQGGQGRRPCPP